MLENGFYKMDCMQGMKEFPDKYFDLAIVDPIYGDVGKGGYVNGTNAEKYYGGAKAKQKTYRNTAFNLPKTGADYFKELFRVSKNQVVWGGNYFTEAIGKDSQGWIVWDKQKPEGVSFADCELAWTSFDRAIRKFSFMWNGMLQGDMKNKEIRIHETQKPVRLYEWILDNYAKQGDLILDTHVGSGSSLIACHNKGFEYVGFEIDDYYYEKAKERLDRETAQLNMFDLMKMGQVGTEKTDNA